MPGTGDDEPLQPTADLLQLANTPFNLGEPRLRAVFDASHAAFAIDRQRKQLADFGEREAEILGATNEAQTLDVFEVELAVARVTARRLREKMIPLVVADRVDADPCLARDFADREAVHDSIPRPQGPEAKPWTIVQSQVVREYRQIAGPEKPARHNEDTRIIVSNVLTTQGFACNAVRVCFMVRIAWRLDAALCNGQLQPRVDGTLSLMHCKTV